MNRVVRLLSVSTSIAVAVVCLSGGVASAQGLSDCLRSGSPTVAGYATGAECPPEGFPYEPLVDITDAGLRAMDPYTDGCSGSIPYTDVDFIRDTAAYFDFRDACATHDYLADLQRFGAAGVTEPGMDDWFLHDMKADCEDRNFVAKRLCVNQAYEYRAGVQQGDYATGDHITTADG